MRRLARRRRRQMHETRAGNALAKCTERAVELRTGRRHGAPATTPIAPNAPCNCRLVERLEHVRRRAPRSTARLAEVHLTAGLTADVAHLDLARPGGLSRPRLRVAVAAAETDAADVL